MVVHFETLFLGIADAFLRVVLEDEFGIDLKSPYSLSYCILYSSNQAKSLLIVPGEHRVEK